MSLLITLLESNKNKLILVISIFKINYQIIQVTIKTFQIIYKNAITFIIIAINHIGIKIFIAFSLIILQVMSFIHLMLFRGFFLIVLNFHINLITKVLLKQFQFKILVQAVYLELFQ
jgi:hypothetical protein